MHFAPKLALMGHHHESKCKVKRLDCFVQGHSHSKCSAFQWMFVQTIFFWTAKPYYLNCWTFYKLNWYCEASSWAVASCKKMFKWQAVFKVTVTVKTRITKIWRSLMSSEHLILLQANLVWWYIILVNHPCDKIGLLFSWVKVTANVKNIQWLFVCTSSELQNLLRHCEPECHFKRFVIVKVTLRVHIIKLWLLLLYPHCIADLFATKLSFAVHRNHHCLVKRLNCCAQGQGYIQIQNVTEYVSILWWFSVLLVILQLKKACWFTISDEQTKCKPSVSLKSKKACWFSVTDRQTISDSNTMT